MWHQRECGRSALILGILLLLPRMTVAIPVADWPNVFDTSSVIELNLDMAPGDWNTVRNDNSLSIEVPAMLSAPGEIPLQVTVRRKSGDMVGDKVSLKIDINDLVSGQEWHGLKKLSLENGDDEDVVSEGFAWYMHRVVDVAKGPDYTAGMANWLNLTVNGASEGVYVNVEQVDKTYLKNRNFWTSGETWLYKQSDINSPELKAGTGDSSTFNALNYKPFATRGQLDPTPDDATLATELPSLINMEGMLTFGAIDAILGAADDLFPKGKNFYYVDFLGGARREYLNWDLDSVIGNVNYDIYGSTNGNEEYVNVILGHPDFRRRYNEILLELLDGPLAPTALNEYLNQLESTLTPSLQADPDSKVGGDVAGHFDSLQQWVIERAANVRQQVYTDMPDLQVILGDMNGDGVLDTNDTDSFVLALVDRAAYEAEFPGLNADVIGDIDGSGTFDLGDIGPFSTLMAPTSSGAVVVPEPTSFFLALMSVASLLLVGRTSGLGRFGRLR